MNGRQGIAFFNVDVGASSVLMRPSVKLYFINVTRC